MIRATSWEPGISRAALFGPAIGSRVVLLVALLPADVQAAEHRHNVRAWLDSTCVRGDAPKGARLWVTWKSKDGALKKTDNAKASAKGQCRSRSGPTRCRTG